MRRNRKTVRRGRIARGALILPVVAFIDPARSFLPTNTQCKCSRNHQRPFPYIFASARDDIDNNGVLLESGQAENLGDDHAWLRSLELASSPNVSGLFPEVPNWTPFLEGLKTKGAQSCTQAEDPLWELVKKEASETLGPEPEVGPQLYQGILSQPCLLESIVTIIANEIETELVKATELKCLFLDMLTLQDEVSIHLDIIAAATRGHSARSAMTATLFHKGLHALVCYRVGHRLWLKGRQGLSYYLQSTVSRSYSADIHPAAIIGSGIYLNIGSGIVIGETAVVGQDVTILQGVTLGGTGKEAGDRHPKVGNGVILNDSATVLGNIAIGEGSVIIAKSIVTKPVPPLACVSGVPATIKSYRELTLEEFEADCVSQHLAFKYMKKWKELLPDLSNNS